MDDRYWKFVEEIDWEGKELKMEKLLLGTY